MSRRYLYIVLILALVPLSLHGEVIGEIKPKSGATLLNTYTWDGKELKPKSGARLANTFVWNGKELKPKSGATLKNTWVYERHEWRQKSGATMSNTWVVDGEIPVPVCALVVLGILR